MKKCSTLILAVLFTFVSVFSFYPKSILSVDAVSSATSESTPPTDSGKPAKTPTKTPVKTQAATKATTTKGKVYVVVNGDKLWKIAEKHNLTLKQIIALNPQIKNPSRIYIGQKINVNAPVSTPVVAAPTSVTTPKSMKVYQGLGQTVAFRNGPGKDSQDVPVYSFTVAMANATFDAQGKILNVYIDAYEVSTPNYDGASMPHFSGWPNKEGYNVTDHATEKVSGVSENTEASAAAEVNSWKTKRERGDSYGMNPANEWYKQMNYYQKFFVGKTIAELEAWFTKNTTSAGRPIKITTTKPEDLEKLSKLSDKEKENLVELTSGATMSIRDAHGDFLGAVANAYKNRVEVEIPVK